MRHAHSFLAAVLAAAALSVPARGQCELSWSACAPQPGITGNGACSMPWDPDGAGPLPQRLVLGGDSLLGGSAVGSQRVMTWDGTAWQALGAGPGTSGAVQVLASWNGLLVAGGTFTGAGTDRIALWNGSAWQPLGPGLATTPVALAVWNGDLVALAPSTVSGAQCVVSVWNGAVWSTLSSGSGIHEPYALAVYQGLLCVGGRDTSGNRGALSVWNGTWWATPYGTDQASTNSVRSLAVRVSPVVGSNQFLYVGGRFDSFGGTPAHNLAVTSGGATFNWSAVGTGPGSRCDSIHVRNVGLSSYVLTARIASAATPVQQYSSGSWSSLGGNAFRSLSYYAASYHVTMFGSSNDACLRHDGTSWVNVRGPSIDGEVRALARSGADVIVGGTIQSTSGVALNRIARWNGTTLEPIGSGMGGTSVDALLVLDNGDVVAGGLFPIAGVTNVNHLARWNGSSWSGFGAGFDQQVLALCKLPNGDVVAGGRFATAGGVACARIARWNGTSWSPLGFGTNGDVHALAVQSDGTLLAGGAFTTAGAASCSRIARWTGSLWQPLGTGTNGDVHALAVRANDEIVAAGAFTSAGGVAADRCARWNGSAWSSMGSTSTDAAAVRSLCVLPNGDVVAGRGFHAPAIAPDAGISRWNGSTWSGFDTGLASVPAGNSVAVRALAVRSDGALFVGGDFGVAGAFTTKALARLTPTCPASAAAYGAGCSSTAGPLVITALTLPWIGSTFRTTTAGVAPGSLCLGVIGLAPLSIPLDALLAEGAPGCSLLASLDILLLLTNGPGNTAHSAFTFANDPSLLGVPFFQQTVPFEFDAGGVLGAVRGSNGLAATIGTL